MPAASMMEAAMDTTTTITEKDGWRVVEVTIERDDPWLEAFLDTVEAGIEATKSGRLVFALEA